MSSRIPNIILSDTVIFQMCPPVLRVATNVPVAAQRRQLLTDTNTWLEWRREDRLMHYPLSTTLSEYYWPTSHCTMKMFTVLQVGACSRTTYSYDHLLLCLVTDGSKHCVEPLTCNRVKFIVHVEVLYQQPQLCLSYRLLFL